MDSPQLLPFPFSTDQAKAYQKDWANFFKQPVEFSNSVGLKFVFIPPGSFLMGSPIEEKNRETDEALHQVIITKGFYLGVTPVTLKQFDHFVQSTGYRTTGEKDGGIYIGNGNDHFILSIRKTWKKPKFSQEENHPAVGLSWDDCVEFIIWLRSLENNKSAYRLPTEVEWEYACRAGTITPFSFGEVISTDLANYCGKYVYGGGPKGKYRKKTTPVDSFPPNAWGLYDMHGNVCEWCQDLYWDYPMEGRKSNKCIQIGNYRVLRSGSWYGLPAQCRSAYRCAANPTFRSNRTGFRLCFPLA